MDLFQLHLLGPIEAVGLDGQPSVFRSAKTRALLAYLVLETKSRSVSRQTLIDLLWPDYLPRSARASLRTTLSNLRAVLAPLELIESNSSTIRFDSTHPNFWCDVLQSGHGPVPFGAKGAGVLFLQDFTLDDCPEFMAWVQAKRRDFLAQAQAAAPSSDVVWSGWDAVPDYGMLVGREAELAQLTQWIVTEKCRLVGIFGQGGQGKSTLAAGFVHSGSGAIFDHIIWCSLLNAPPWESMVDEWIFTLSPSPLLRLPVHAEGRLAHLMRLLTRQRCLIVLDNLETILDPESPAGRFQPRYAEFSRFLELMSNTSHRSSLLITSREQPSAYSRWLQSSKEVRQLFLAGLSVESGCQLLRGYLSGQTEELAALVKRFSGNPLALQLAARTVQTIFGDDVSILLADDLPIFSDLQDVLLEQIDRLSNFEKWILFQLAVLREPVSWITLSSYLPSGHTSAQLMNGLQSLQRRSLINIYHSASLDLSSEQANVNLFGLQNVILEFTTDRLVEALVEEIQSGKLYLLRSLSLMRADTLEYIRVAQGVLFLDRILPRIRFNLGELGSIRRLHTLVDDLRSGIREQAGYAVTNILHLLLALSPTAIQGADFSSLSIPGAYLRDGKLPQVNFAGSDLSAAAFTLLLSSVRSVAAHPGGRKVAVGAVNGVVWLWEIPEQRVYSLPIPSRHMVNWLAFTPDGNLLVHTTADGGVHLWDMGANQLYHEFKQGNGHALAISPDGCVVAGLRDDRVWLWDVKMKSFLSSLTGHGASMLAVAFCPDGKTLISSDRAGFVYVWDWQSAQLVGDWRGGKAEITRLSIHPAGDRLAAVIGANGQIWDLQGKALSPVLTGDSHIVQIAFHPSGEFLAGSTYSGQIYIWQTETARLIRLFRSGHNPNGLAFSPNGQWLMIGSADQSVNIWDVASGRPLHKLSGHRHAISGLAISGDGARLAYGGNGMTIYLCQSDDLTPLGEWSCHDHTIMTLAFHPQGRLLASGSVDCSVRLWDSTDGREVNVLWGHTWAVERVLFHPRRPLLVSAAIDGEICVWDVEGGRLMSKTAAHGAWISDLVFSPDGSLLISCAGDKRICLWSVSADSVLVKTAEIQAPVELGYGPLATLLDHRHLAFGTERGIHLYDLVEGQTVGILSGHKPWVTGLASSRDGALLASTGVENSLCLWESVGGALRWRQDIESLTQTMAFSPDGTRLYTGNAEGILEIWDTASGERVDRQRIPDPYAGMNIRGVTGITEAQRLALLDLGAVEV